MGLQPGRPLGVCIRNGKWPDIHPGLRFERFWTAAGRGQPSSPQPSRPNPNPHVTLTGGLEGNLKHRSLSPYTPYIGPGWVLNVRFKCLKISVLRPYAPCIGPGWVLKMRFKTFRNHRCSVISEIVVKNRRFLAL